MGGRAQQRGSFTRRGSALLPEPVSHAPRRPRLQLSDLGFSLLLNVGNVSNAEHGTGGGVGRAGGVGDNTSKDRCQPAEDSGDTGQGLLTSACHSPRNVSEWLSGL